MTTQGNLYDVPVSIGSGSGFVLGDASYYAVIAFNPYNFTTTANTPIYGDIGVGGYNSINLNGDTVYASLETTGAAPKNTGGTVTGGVDGYNPRLGPDITALRSLSYLAGAECGTGIYLHNCETLQASAGTLDSHGNEIFAVWNWSDNLTINGASGQHVILNVEPGVTLKLDNLHLTGGLTPNDVLINYGGNATVTGVSGDVFQATVLAPFSRISLGGVTVYGHVYGGAPGQTFQLSGSTIVAPAVIVATTSGRALQAFAGAMAQMPTEAAGFAVAMRAEAAHGVALMAAPRLLQAA